MQFKQVIGTLTTDGQEVMGPDTLIWHHPEQNILNGALLTVESNHFCVLKSRGAILNVYEMGQFPVQTPDHPLVGSIQQAFFGGQSPFQFEAIYVNRAKLVTSTQGSALSAEMAEMSYDVDYYIHVASKEAATTLVQHVPYRGHALTTADLNAYAGPVIAQAVNQLVQVTPMEQVNEKIHELSDLVHQHLQEFLAAYGITLDTVKVLVRPSDPRMKALIALKAFGLTDKEAVRYYTAMVMAEHGLISAPNMAVGESFHIGGVQPTMPVPEMAHATHQTASPPGRHQVPLGAGIGMSQ